METTALEILETGEEGNTELSPPVKDQPLQYLHHAFTWNNYSPDSIEILITLFNHIAYDYVFQEEIAPTTGTPHLQGTVSLKKRMRWTEFGLPRVIHWSKVSKLDSSYVYCSDPLKRAGKCWSLKWPIPGKLKIINESMFYQWQKDIIEYIKTEPDDRTIYWVWSEEGSIGKSQFCKYLAHVFNAVLCGKGQYSDIMNIMFKANMDKTNLVVFDLPRNNGNKISYSALESIKNGLIVNTKYETGSKLFNSPHILVFSNMAPDKPALSGDRWKIVKLD